MSPPRRTERMPVKAWSMAGLILTTWCPGRCASCYLCCGPDRDEWMSLDEALGAWQGLVQAGPRGCRIHLTGGEPMGRWDFLLDLCRRAAAEGLRPLDKIETNAYWATDERVVRERLRALDAAGMRMLSISADPYHQQFVAIKRCRLLARTAADVLGPGRVQVRWRDWLAEGFDTGALPAEQRDALFARFATGGRDRLNGRAALMLAPHLPHKPARAFADISCGEALLRSRHVHVAPGGVLLPGVCAGIVVGRLGDGSVGELWRRLSEDHAFRPVVGALTRGGPAALLDEAAACGFAAGGYASKCHLCWEVRRHFVRCGLHADELGPPWMYRSNLSLGGD